VPITSAPPQSYQPPKALPPETAFTRPQERAQGLPLPRSQRASMPWSTPISMFLLRKTPDRSGPHQTYASKPRGAAGLLHHQGAMGATRRASARTMVKRRGAEICAHKVRTSGLYRAVFAVPPLQLT
jgi:hypothetical protein